MKKMETEIQRLKVVAEEAVGLEAEVARLQNELLVSQQEVRKWKVRCQIVEEQHGKLRDGM